MALTPVVLFDAYISINSNVISDHANKCEIPITAAEEDLTAFGATWKARTGGLKDGQLSIDLFQNFTASQLDSIFWPLLGTVVPFEVRPTSSARAVGNPGYTGNLFIKEWKPIFGAVGKLSMVSVSFPTSGAVLRQTS